MGVDCKIHLPDNVRVKDVAEVLGVLAGLKPTKHNLGSNSKDAWYAEVSDAKVEATNDPSMCLIILCGKMVDGIEHHEVFYFFENSGGGRLLYPRSTAFWIACGRGLVCFFGGSMDYNDCDDSYNDFHTPEKCDEWNCPENGADWQNLQERIYTVKPVTAEELKALQCFAAY